MCERTIREITQFCLSKSEGSEQVSKDPKSEVFGW